MSIRKKTIIIVCVILAVVAFVAGLIAGFNKTAQAESDSVSTITLTKKNLEKQITVTGKVSPENSRDITTDSMGKIKEVKVSEHDKVDEGDVLCKTEDTSIKAPIDGTVTFSSAKKGEYPKAGENLFVIEDLSKMEVVASITEYDVLDAKKGMKVTVTTDAKEGQEWTGEVTDISETATDDKSNFTIKIKIDKPGKYLKGGMTAKAKLILHTESDIYAVPYDAIEKASGNAGYVYVDNGDEADKRYEKIQIATGLETDYYVQIQGDKLKDGIKIVSNSKDINKIKAQKDS